MLITKKRLELRILPAMGHVKIGNIRQKTLNDYKKCYMKPISAQALKTVVRRFDQQRLSHSECNDQLRSIPRIT